MDERFTFNDHDLVLLKRVSELQWQTISLYTFECSGLYLKDADKLDVIETLLNEHLETKRKRKTGKGATRTTQDARLRFRVQAQWRIVIISLRNWLLDILKPQHHSMCWMDVLFALRWLCESSKDNPLGLGTKISDAWNRLKYIHENWIVPKMLEQFGYDQFPEAPSTFQDQHAATQTEAAFQGLVSIYRRYPQCFRGGFVALFNRLFADPQNVLFNRLDEDMKNLFPKDKKANTPSDDDAPPGGGSGSGDDAKMQQTAEKQFKSFIKDNAKIEAPKGPAPSEVELEQFRNNELTQSRMVEVQRWLFEEAPREVFVSFMTRSLAPEQKPSAPVEPAKPPTLDWMQRLMQGVDSLAMLLIGPLTTRGAVAEPEQSEPLPAGSAWKTFWKMDIELKAPSVDGTWYAAVLDGYQNILAFYNQPISPQTDGIPTWPYLWNKRPEEIGEKAYLVVLWSREDLQTKWRSRIQKLTQKASYISLETGPLSNGDVFEREIKKWFVCPRTYQFKG